MNSEQLKAEDFHEMESTYNGILNSSVTTPEEAFVRTVAILKNRGAQRLYTEDFDEWQQRPAARPVTDPRSAGYVGNTGAEPGRIEAYHSMARRFHAAVRYRVDVLREDLDGAYLRESQQNRVFNSFAEYQRYIIQFAGTLNEQPSAITKAKPDPERAARQAFYTSMVTRQTVYNQDQEQAFKSQTALMPGVFGSYKEYVSFLQNPAI